MRRGATPARFLQRCNRRYRAVVTDGVAAGVQQLLAHLERLERREALNLILPPLPPAEAASSLQIAGLSAAEPLLEWFGSWGGQASGGLLGDMDVLPGFYALSLPDSLAHRRQHEDWSKSWLPLLADGGGDFYIGDTALPEVPVLRHRSDEPDAEAVANSLAAFVSVAASAFDREVIYVNAGYLDQDEEEWRRLLGVA
jgi:hypothetical protein